MNEFSPVDVALVECKFNLAFPEILIKWRTNRHLSQIEVCRGIGMLPQQYNSYEMGYSLPSLFNLYRIMCFYKFQDFLEWE